MVSFTTFSVYVLVMIGLKTFIPALAAVLGVSELALYERQRSLVRDGLLTKTEGQGPGSGVRFTSEAVATLLIAILTTSSLKKTSEEMPLWLNAKSDRRDTDRKAIFDLGGATTFRAAMVHALTSDEKVAIVRVYRADGFAAFISGHSQLTFKSKKKPSTTAFNEIGQIYVEPIRALVRNALEAGASAQKKSKAKEHVR